MKLAVIAAALAAGWTVVATVAAVVVGRHLASRDEMWPAPEDEPTDGEP